MYIWIEHSGLIIFENAINSIHLHQTTFYRGQIQIHKEKQSLIYLAHYLFLKFCSRRSESFSQATSFSANLPNFNPAMPKFNSFARNSQTSQSKTIRINSVPNTSKIMYVYGFFDDSSKTLSNLVVTYWPPIVGLAGTNFCTIIYHICTL